jgi:hypothetical protein
MRSLDLTPTRRNLMDNLFDADTYGHASRGDLDARLERLSTEPITESLLHEIAGDSAAEENLLVEMADELAAKFPGNDVVEDLLAVQEGWAELEDRAVKALAAIAEVRALAMRDDIGKAIVIGAGGTVPDPPTAGL